MDDVIPGDLADGALVLLVLDRVFAFVKGMRGKANGHSAVRPQDAPEFYLLQREIDRKLDLVVDEVLNHDVKRHHRA